MWPKIAVRIIFFHFKLPVFSLLKKKDNYPDFLRIRMARRPN